MKDLEGLTDEDLKELHQRKMNSHDYLIDNADMGDDRIYFLGKDIDRIEEELKRRGLRSF